MGADDPAWLLARMDRNLAEHACHLHRHAPGMTVLAADDLVVADSGLADDTFNIVAAARFGTGTAAGRIAETGARLAATGRPFCWWVGPASTPADLSARLAAAGYPTSGRETAMWAPLDDLPAPLAPAGLTIRIAATAAELDGFADVVARNWDPPARTVRRFVERTAAWALAPECPARYLVGYLAGRPVCAAEILLSDGVAGVYNVCTLAAQRRRGYGAAVTLAGLHRARAEGAPVAVLQASGEGAAVYGRLGFRPCGEYREHAIAPG